MARKGLGEFAFFVKNSVYKDYHINGVDHEFNSIIALSVKDKISKFNILLVGTYVPPETSVYGDDLDRVFQEMLSLMYENANSNADSIFVMGDFNTRVSRKNDVIDEIDDIPERILLDIQHNDHGVSLINFLLQANACIVNGRVNPSSDAYTSISHYGKVVVDYLLASHNSLKYVTNFEVLNVPELLLKYSFMYSGATLEACSEIIDELL